MTKEEAINILDNIKPHCGEKAVYSEGELCEAFDMAIAALREQEELENPKPLTLDELMQTVGCSVWWDWNGEYCLCKNGYVVTNNGTFSFDFVVKNGNVYRCKPKE